MTNRTTTFLHDQEGMQHAGGVLVGIDERPISPPLAKGGWMQTAVTTLKAGDMLPDLTLPLLNGGDLSFTDLRGKRLLLYFWGSW